MKAIIRNLFGERSKKYKEVITTDYFSEDLIIKILQLMYRYNISYRIPSLGLHEKEIKVVNLFLDRLGYLIKSGIITNDYGLEQIKDYLVKSKLSEFFTVLELYCETLFEVSNKASRVNIYFGYIEEFNNLLAYHKTKFKLVFNEEINKAHIEKIDSELEEKNKEIIYNLIKDEPKVNQYFTKALENFSKRDFKDSIENAYLTLEKYLKIKINNHKLDANASFKEFQKKFSRNFKGIFSVKKDILKNKISFIETIRSELKSHSDKETFDTNEFLEETAKFQINEVMNTIILLNNIVKK